MNKKILIITVGGSDEPIVTSIKAHNPDFIYFICSGGKCPAASERIVDSTISQSGYEKDYEKVILDNPDDFTEVYNKTKETIQKAKKKKYNIIADFTGGTKTMSNVLGILTAFNFDINPSLVKGVRTDIEKIKSDSCAVIENFESVRIDYILQIVHSFLSKYLYFPVLLILEDVLKIGMSGENQQKIINIHSVIQSFHYWDTFNYNDAYKNLKNFTSIYSAHFQYLLKLLDKTTNSGYENVFDLISNAKRQADNGFYDNGVARIYRALELFAQIRLKTKYNIDTSHLEKALFNLKDKIDIEKWKKYANEEGEIKLGLIKVYELLIDLGDEIGEVYKTRCVFHSK